MFRIVFKSHRSRYPPLIDFIMNILYKILSHIWRNKMDKLQLKYNNIQLAAEIKQNKAERKSSARSGNYYITNYSGKEKSDASNWDNILLQYGRLYTGAAWYLQGKLVKQKTEARAYNILNAFFKGRRFDTVEKYYYNKGIDYMIATITKDKKAYSLYCNRKHNQSLALDRARILLGSYKLKTGSVYKKKGKPQQASLIKEAIPHEEFDKWVLNTHTSI